MTKVQRVEDEYRAALEDYGKARTYWEDYLLRLRLQARVDGCSHPKDLQLSYEQGDDYYSTAFVTTCRVCGARRVDRYSSAGDWTND